MSTFGTRRRVTAWIAALAVLLGALAPALSHALASTQGKQWIEICTSSGSKWVKLSDDGTDEQPLPAHSLEHCPFCSLHLPAPGLPPAPLSLTLPLRLSHEVPLAFLSAPRTLHAWVSAQPRAPPLFS